MRRFASLTMAAAAAVAAGMLAAPAPGSATAPAAPAGERTGQAVPPPELIPRHRITVELHRIRCSNTEDSVGNDELVVKYDGMGQKLWQAVDNPGEYSFFPVKTAGSTGQRSVGNRSWVNYSDPADPSRPYLPVFSQPIDGAQEFTFTLTMWDEDSPDPNDNLGRVSKALRANELPLGVTDYSQRFEKSNSDYTIYYRITNEIIGS